MMIWIEKRKQKWMEMDKQKTEVDGISEMRRDLAMEWKHQNADESEQEGDRQNGTEMNRN